MNAATYDFTDIIQKCARQSEWEIATIDDKHAVFRFSMKSGREQILYVYKYGSVLEFSVPSLAKFDLASEIPDQLSISLLMRNSQKKIGFWCIEKIGEKLVFSFMYNLELQLLDSESFNEIVRTLVQECDIFEGCLLENEQESDSLQDSLELSPEYLSECFRELSYSKRDSKSNEAEQELHVYRRDGDKEDGFRVVNKHRQISNSQIDISEISFERVGNFSEFILELKKLSNELAKSNNDSIRQANNEVRKAIEEGESQNPDGQSILKQLQNAWNFVKGLGEIGVVISKAITVLSMMMTGVPMR